jgi:hypothetical protein
MDRLTPVEYWTVSQVSKQPTGTLIITVPLDPQSPLSRIRTETCAGSTTW